MILPNLVMVTPGGTDGRGVGIVITAVSSGNGSVSSSVGCVFVNLSLVMSSGACFSKDPVTYRETLSGPKYCFSKHP